MNSFDLALLATDRKVYTGPCESLIVPAIDGEYGIQAHHEPVVLALHAGELRYTVNGKTEVLAVGDGFAEVTEDQVVVLTDFAERADEIDLIRAEAAKKRAEERLRSRRDALTVAHAQAALARAVARIKVYSLGHHR